MCACLPLITDPSLHGGVSTPTPPPAAHSVCLLGQVNGGSMLGSIVNLFVCVVRGCRGVARQSVEQKIHDLRSVVVVQL